VSRRQICQHQYWLHRFGVPSGLAIASCCVRFNRNGEIGAWKRDQASRHLAESAILRGSRLGAKSLLSRRGRRSFSHFEPITHSLLATISGFYSPLAGVSFRSLLESYNELCLKEKGGDTLTIFSALQFLNNPPFRFTSFVLGRSLELVQDESVDMAESATSPLQAQMQRLLDRRKQQSKLRSLKASLAGSVDFSSNDFLSLSTSPVLRAIFLDELKSTSQLGSTGSRLLDGNSSYAENLEQDIATFHNGPTGLLVNSGFDANVGIFSCLPQPGDIIVYDELIHASVHDGIKASRAGRTVPFAHNSASDLQNVLEDVVTKSSAASSYNVFIAVESVYSMDGDLAPLNEIVECVEAVFPRKNAYIIVDEAHATGIYGEKGRGRVCELGLEERVFIRLHTFGKALACNGGKKAAHTPTQPANTCSDHHMHTTHTSISHQLCSAFDLHNFHVISSTCCNQGCLHLHGPGSDKRIGQGPRYTHQVTTFRLTGVEKPLWNVGADPKSC
jgi:7-keto-8-aminopelargonate synthetase-like enzyme